jgi:hypothetical protein
METSLILSLGGLLTNLAVAAAALVALGRDRAKTNAETRKADALEAVAKSQSTIVQSLEREVRVLRDEIGAMRAQAGAQAVMAQVKLADIEEKKRRAEWQRTKDLAKGLGWLLQNSD